MTLPPLAAVLLAVPLLLGSDYSSASADEFPRPGAEGNPQARTADPAALPDIFGPGSVLTTGRVQMKVTNFGVLGNPFTNFSSDPSGQWPGASGIEYLYFISFAVGAVNRSATIPAERRRVSYNQEWRPATLDSEDRIYQAREGIVNGEPFFNDDGDRDPLTNEPLIDEDFLDGRDNDGDGLIDEDHAAVGQQLFSLVMRDDTREAVNTVFNEKHVPLGLECRQRAWAYSVPGFQDFVVVEYEVINRSGHTLDSLMLGWNVNMDAGPFVGASYWLDDFNHPQFPQGVFPIAVARDTTQVSLGTELILNDPARHQVLHHRSLPRFVGTIPADSSLCPIFPVRVNGFTTVDNDNDGGMTPGAGTFLLFDHTTDVLGLHGPSRVGFKSFRSYVAAQKPYSQGGNPTIDEDRFEFMASGENVSGGVINAPVSDERNDWSNWCSIGPWRNVPDGGSVSATIGFMVSAASDPLLRDYPQDLERYQRGQMALLDLLDKYPGLKTALAAQIAYEGMHEPREGYLVTDFHGRETPLRTAPGAPPFTTADCTDDENGAFREVNDRGYTWFDFDCDYCTGVWQWDADTGTPRVGQGLFHRPWVVPGGVPPPNPNLNTARNYNFTDNPHRIVAPSADDAIVLAWDNLSETVPDPKTHWFDFRGYRIWKVADWARPVGSSGPAEHEWQMIGEFRLFEYSGPQGVVPNNKFVNATGDTVCPKVYIPKYLNPATGTIGPDSVEICLEHGDLWNEQTGQVIKPDPTVRCLGDFADPYEDVNGDGFPDSCQVFTGCRVHSVCSNPLNTQRRLLYKVGRYEFTDRTVKNGFTYFYSVTGFDSTTHRGVTTEVDGRPTAVGAEAVVPQAAPRAGQQVWVVPNPYRGFKRISDRPSAWDLAPSTTDPTGTYIDFMGLPRSRWTIRIYTVAGDLVQELRSGDAINALERRPVEDPFDSDVVHSGVTRQRDNPSDGQARWTLISRNGQDVVSGIYLFTVESSEGTQRGRFVVIR